MQACEVCCVAVCCHGQAFDLNPDHVRRWANTTGEEEFAFAQRQLKHLIKKIAYAEGSVECPEFFWLSGKDELLAWLREWEQVVQEAANITDLQENPLERD